MNNKIGFWRRLVAFWVDVFIIYSVTKIFIELLALVDFRISFETLFVIIGAAYSFFLLTKFKQTIGKMLFNIEIVSKNDSPINYRKLVLHEIVGKWGITITLPIILGSFLLGNYWLPTVFTILLMFLVTFFCWIFYLFAKQTWYDYLSGLTIKRVEPSKRIKHGFYVLLLIAFAGIGLYAIQLKTSHRIHCRMEAFQNAKSTKPYVDFLNEQTKTPVDYVISLFDKYDVVVLCERIHPEMTQWDFIYDIVRNPKFIEKSGIIFTEYGHVGMQDYLDKFMATDSLSDNEIQNRIIHIQRNMAVWPAWTNYNLHTYLKRLYHLNRSLPPEKRIKHYFTDAAIDWSTITSQEKMKEYQIKLLGPRDKIMAQNIITKIRDLAKSSTKPPKCLVIMNYRHAWDFTEKLPQLKSHWTYEYLKDTFKNRAANVLINSRILIGVPVVNGVWEAAFEKIGNKPLGFDFQDSPFGADKFDLYPFRICNSLFKNMKYGDVFTGYVYANPIKDFVLNPVTPHLFDGFEKEYLRRAKYKSKLSNMDMEGFIKQYKTNPSSMEKRGLDLSLETATELTFYSISMIGFLIGIFAFLVKRKKIVDN